MARKKTTTSKASAVQTLASTAKRIYISLNNLGKFLSQIISAPTLEMDQDTYLLGVYNGKLCKFIYHAGGQVGDICFYDAQEDKLLIVSFDTWNNNLDVYPASRFTPIGVIVVPKDHNVYGNGKCGVMSLKYMSYSTPDSGRNNYQRMAWGYSGNEISKAQTFGNCIVIGSQISPGNGSPVGVNTSGRLPSDAFSRQVCPTDPKAFYSAETEEINACPSPYLPDGSRNTVYYQNLEPTEGEIDDYGAGEGNCLSDFDGKVNSLLCLDHVTVSNWKTSSTISNSSNPGNYPAVCVCWRFCPKGTNQGDWYLPSMGELGYLMVRLKAINTTIEKLIEVYGSDIGGTIADEDVLWSSTDFSVNSAWYLGESYGGVEKNNKGSGNISVRAFLQV